MTTAFDRIVIPKQGWDYVQAPDEPNALRGFDVGMDIFLTDGGMDGTIRRYTVRLVTPKGLWVEKREDA